MSEIKNGGLDQYGAEPFKQQQFGIAGVVGVKTAVKRAIMTQKLLRVIQQKDGLSSSLSPHYLVKDLR